MFGGPVECDLVLDCVTKIGFTQGVLNFLRYYPIAGLAFLLFYVWRKDFFETYRIQKVYPKAEKVWKEFRQSAVTLLVFTLVAVTNITLMKAKIVPSAVYFGPVTSWSGIGYIFLSFALFTIWHETWFYWMHRFAHIKKFTHMSIRNTTNPSILLHLLLTGSKPQKHF